MKHVINVNLLVSSECVYRLELKLYILRRMLIIGHDPFIAPQRYECMLFILCIINTHLHLHVRRIVSWISINENHQTLNFNIQQMVQWKLFVLLTNAFCFHTKTQKIKSNQIKNDSVGFSWGNRRKDRRNFKQNEIHVMFSQFSAGTRLDLFDN